MPVPSMSAGIIASPLFARSGPAGLTLADLLPFVKRQTSVFMV